MPGAAILTYHSLDDSGSVVSTPPRVFAEQMRRLSQASVKVVSLAEAYHGRQACHGPPLVALTFDDGFRNLHDYALPVLQRYGFPATVFLVTDYCGRTNFWPGQPTTIPRAPLLRWTEVKMMRDSGVTFGSHTRTHARLTSLKPCQVEAELVMSKQRIEDTLGEAVDTFAYPYGVYDGEVRRLVATHFDLACSTDLGFLGAASDPLSLERLDTYYLRHPASFQRLFSPVTRGYIQWRAWLRTLRRCLTR